MHLVENLDDAMALKRWLGERHENNAVAVDTETTGLDPPERGPVSASSSSATRCTAGLSRGRTGAGLRREVLHGWEGQWIYHNISFEMKWMHHYTPSYRIPRDRSVDTMLAAHIINPLGAGGLKPLSSKYVDRGAAAGQEALDNGMAANGWTWATVPITYEPYWAYGASTPC